MDVCTFGEEDSSQVSSEQDGSRNKQNSVLDAKPFDNEAEENHDDDDDDAWLRDDVISLDDEEEEIDKMLPFGLNQSWPRMSQSAARHKKLPGQTRRKLLRQISQESLDESTNLLLPHIVMLSESHTKDRGLHLLSQPPEEEEHNMQKEEEVLVRMSNEDEAKLISKEDGVKHHNEGKDPCHLTNSCQEASETNLDDSNHCDINDDVPREDHSLNGHKETKECIAGSEHKQSDGLGPCFMKRGWRDNSEGYDQPAIGDSATTRGQAHITALTDETINSLQPVDADYSPLTQTSFGTESALEGLLTKQLSNIFKEDVVTDCQGLMEKTCPSVTRTKPPLLRHISQESFEESTSLLLDHVVLMDFKREHNGMVSGQEVGHCPYLVDIAETPLLGEGAVLPVKEGHEDEEQFLYRGEIYSADEVEEDEVEEDEGDIEKDRSLLHVAVVTEPSIICDEAASALKDIEVTRVDLDDAILAMQSLGDEFPPTRTDVHDIDEDLNYRGIGTDVPVEQDCEEGPKDSTLFNKLPQEILLHIFQYFTHVELCMSVALVCKKWHHLALDPLLWKHLDFSNKTNIHPDVMRAVFSRCCLLQSVSFRGRDEVHISDIQALVDHCPNVRDIQLGFVDNVHDTMFSTLVSGCPLLTSLNVEGCDRITDGLVSRLILFQRLKSLNLSHCTKLTDGAVFEIARFCDHLEELDIDGIPWISDSAVILLTKERRDTMRILKLDGAELSDISVHRAMLCPNLEELNISFCEQLTDRTLCSLQLWKRPRRLRLQKGKEFSEAALTSLFLSQHLSNLTFLDLSECSELRDQGLINIANRCPLLTHLAVEWCWFITDVGLVQVMEKCRYLQHLDLIGLHAILGNCLADIPTKLPQLTYLDLRQCNRITDAMLVQIVSVKPDLLIINYYGEEVTHNIPSTLEL